MNLHNHITDEELIKGCLHKKQAFQKMLFDRYAPAMLGLCQRYIKDHHEAECIMIEGFSTVFRSIKQFSQKGSFEGWIKRIMINCCLGYLRKNKSFILQVEISEANAIIDDSISDHLENEELLRMIERLPAGYRTVFNLYAIEGYSHKEIARELKISINTSKSQLSRARILLQRFLLEAAAYSKNKLHHYETSGRPAF